MKKKNMCGMQIGSRTLLNDEDFKITDTKNIDSMNDFSISKRQK